MVTTVWFKIFGVLTLMFETLLLFTLAGPRARQLGPLLLPAIIRISVFFFASTSIAIGLLFLRKWAAMFFSLVLSVIAVWLILVSIMQVPFAWNLINIFLGIVLMFPAIVTMRDGSHLSWGGKWFF